MLHKPKWIRTSWQQTSEARQVRAILREKHLYTVCEESSCPNRGECYNRGTCTFLIMGSICTRGCRFCDVTHGHPLPLDPSEPEKVAYSIRELGVKYAVITSVDRDDLPDFGAAHFAETIESVKRITPGVKIEVLTPDFQNSKRSIDTVLQAGPDVFAHNLETVRRMTRKVRDKRADYDRSLEVLSYVAGRSTPVLVKSGIMAGLGETDDEVIETLEDIYHAGARSITIGQYLAPNKYSYPVDRYVHPDMFSEYKQKAVSIGYEFVMSGPQIRSSYHADEQLKGF